MIYEVTLTRESKVREFVTLTVEADNDPAARSQALADCENGNPDWGVLETIDSEAPEIESVEPIADGTEDIREKVS